MIALLAVIIWWIVPPYIRYNFKPPYFKARKMQRFRVYFILATLIVALLASVQVLRYFGNYAANRTWSDGGIPFEALLKESEPKWWEINEDKRPTLHDNYKKCRDRLELIFADKQSYYMLC